MFHLDNFGVQNCDVYISPLAAWMWAYSAFPDAVTVSGDYSRDAK